MNKPKEFDLHINLNPGAAGAVIYAADLTKLTWISTKVMWAIRIRWRVESFRRGERREPLNEVLKRAGFQP